MIFYFTGTGNSQYAAAKLAGEDERIISMAECIKNKEFEFEIAEGEKLGFSFPVYYGGLPSIVQSFLSHAVIKGSISYTYAVITCGAKIYGAGKMLEKRLAEKGIALQAVYPVIMPDNYIVMYSIQSEEEEITILEDAENKLDEIAKMIEEQENSKIKGSVLTNVMYPLYAKGRKTKKFWTDDRCVSCGVCASRCPSRAIELIDGKVTWVKDQCAHCMACARCNAIQYGRKSVNRRRYTHPMLRKKHH